MRYLRVTNQNGPLLLNIEIIGRVEPDRVFAVGFGLITRLTTIEGVEFRLKESVEEIHQGIQATRVLEKKNEPPNCHRCRATETPG